MALYLVMNLHLVCPRALNVKIKRSFKKKVLFTTSVYTHTMEACRKKVCRQVLV